MVELKVFSLKDLQNALVVLNIMERNNTTKEAIKEYIKTRSTIVSHSHKKIKRVRRLSKAQRSLELSRTRWGRRRK